MPSPVPHENIIDDKSEEQSGTFNTGEFLEKNYYLFATLGIFGATSVYIFDINAEIESQDPTTIGFVSSLFLFLLTALTIHKRLISHVGSIDYIIKLTLFKPSLESFELSIFLIAYYSLIYSITGISLDFLSSSSRLIQIFAIIFGFAMTIGSLRNINNYTNIRVSVSKDTTFTKFLKSVLILFITSIIVVNIGDRIIKYSGYDQIFQFNETDPVSPIIAAFGYGVEMVGFLYLLLTIVIAIGYSKFLTVGIINKLKDIL